MIRRAAKITMLPSRGLSAKLAGAVLPALQGDPAKLEKKPRWLDGQIMSIEPHAKVSRDGQ